VAADGASVGLVGLGTMGRGLAHALTRAGLRVAAFEPLAGGGAAPDGVTVYGDLPAMAAALRPPRRVLLMVTAGAPVDAMIAALAPALAPGDIVIDGGNAHFRDTERRAAELAPRGIRYLGVGVSGGERGARAGASVMAGGPAEAFAAARDVLEAIAASDEAGRCCAHLGPGGAGHFIKMVHNGIEYAMLQAIGEAWLALRRLTGQDDAAIAATFRDWNEGALGAYLLDIAATVLETTDPQTGFPILDVIDDAAGQTGTGRWLVTEAMELGVPVPTIAEAVAARSLSAMTEARAALEQAAPGTGRRKSLPAAAFRDALLGSVIVSYAQGFAVIRAAAGRYGWPVAEETVATLWRKGCIIQSRLLPRIAAAYRHDPDLPILLLDDGLRDLLRGAERGWRRAVGAALEGGLPLPAMGSALAWYDALRGGRLWTALTQAQRDLFGAHTYARTDRPGRFHTDWPDGE